MTRVTPFLNNINDMFAAMGDLVTFKRKALDSFLSEDYNRMALLQKLRNVELKNIIPAKVDFVATLLNNSDSDMNSIMQLSLNSELSSPW